MTIARTSCMRRACSRLGATASGPNGALVIVCNTSTTRSRPAADSAGGHQHPALVVVDEYPVRVQLPCASLDMLAHLHRRRRVQCIDIDSPEAIRDDVRDVRADREPTSFHLLAKLEAVRRADTRSERGGDRGALVAPPGKGLEEHAVRFDPAAVRGQVDVILQEQDLHCGGFFCTTAVPYATGNWTTA